MINFQVFGLCNLLKYLISEEHDLSRRRDLFEAELKTETYSKGLKPFLEQQPVPSGVDDTDIERINSIVQMAVLIVTEMEMSAGAHRIRLFTKRLRSNISVTDCLGEVRALREAIEGELRHQYFYRYPKNKMDVAREVEADWKAVTDKFPSAKPEAISAADCYAVGHGTACVFHLMRIAEYGLRALARERRVRLPRRQVLEWADWQIVIQHITAKVGSLASKRRGPTRDAALEFYRGAIGSFEGFKDAYRNNYWTLAP